MLRTITRLFWAMFFTVTLLVPAIAAPGTGDRPRNIPTQVEADRMESNDQDNSVVFSGKVVARQGDLVIHSDTMTVYYLSGAEKKNLAPGDQRKIKKLYADGQVKIENENWVATSDHLEFFEIERKVKLTGNARAWQGNNMVTGDSILLFLDQGKSIVERSKKGDRVKAFFYPGGEKGKDGR